jgi:hypothetical protein
MGREPLANGVWKASQRHPSVEQKILAPFHEACCFILDGEPQRERICPCFEAID